jgi:ring-1,2-phenylacetyl-CoA epoxidase subunit PaaB
LKPIISSSESLDPRVNRLPEIGTPGVVTPKAPLDQWGTFEVFVQPKEGKPFQHEGAVHAADLELAYVLAKETFTRRFACTSLYVVDTRDVFVSPVSEGSQNAYHLLPEIPPEPRSVSFEVYHLLKRGKQHVHAGTIQAATPAGALAEARKKFGDKQVFNIWVIQTDRIRFTSDTEKDLWLTLPEKKFRDASDYKGGDKLKEFLERK